MASRFLFCSTLYTTLQNELFCGEITTALILDSFIMGADGQLPISPHMFLLPTSCYSYSHKPHLEDHITQIHTPTKIFTLN